VAASRLIAKILQKIIKSSRKPNVLKKQRTLYKPGSPEWDVQLSRDVREFAKTRFPHKSPGKQGVSIGKLASNYRPVYPDNPLKPRIRERLMAGRGEPGVKAGLDRMRARMFDKFNQGIAPAVTQRAANFNSLIGTDKGFRAFLTDVVGAKTVQSMTPRMRDKLAKQYISLRRRGLSGKDARFREYEVADEAGLRTRNFDYSRGPEPVSKAYESIIKNLN
jgi:hypothetical protein